MLEFSPCSRKWIWNVIPIRVPRCGSTSLWDHCGDFNLLKKYEKMIENVLGKKKTYQGFFNTSHAKYYEIFGILGSGVKEYLSFGSVRNPWDRTVSLYHGIQTLNKSDVDKIKLRFGVHNFETHSFEGLCLLLEELFNRGEKHFMFTQPQIEWFKGAFKPNFILRFENLQKDFEEMILSHDIKHISSKLLHVNSSKDRKDFRSYYNSKTKKIIEKIFEKDIDAFKYTY
jgi:hypothetical protein